VAIDGEQQEDPDAVEPDVATSDSPAQPNDAAGAEATEPNVDVPDVPDVPDGDSDTTAETDSEGLPVLDFPFVADMDHVAIPKDVLPPELPDGWLAGVDEASGDTYYYNTVTETSQWDLPTKPATAAADSDEPVVRAYTDEEDSEHVDSQGAKLTTVAPSAEDPTDAEESPTEGYSGFPQLRDAAGDPPTHTGADDEQLPGADLVSRVPFTERVEEGGSSEHMSTAVEEPVSREHEREGVDDAEKEQPDKKVKKKKKKRDKTHRERGADTAETQPEAAVADEGEAVETAGGEETAVAAETGGGEETGGGDETGGAEAEQADGPVEDADGNNNVWEEVYTDDGDKYYYNTETHETSWTLPGHKKKKKKRDKTKTKTKRDKTRSHAPREEQGESEATGAEVDREGEEVGAEHEQASEAPRTRIEKRTVRAESLVADATMENVRGFVLRSIEEEHCKDKERPGPTSLKDRLKRKLESKPKMLGSPNLTARSIFLDSLGLQLWQGPDRNIYVQDVTPGGLMEATELVQLGDVMIELDGASVLRRDVEEVAQHVVALANAAAANGGNIEMVFSRGAPSTSSHQLVVVLLPQHAYRTIEVEVPVSSTTAQ